MLNVRFIFIFILLSISIFIFIEVPGNLQCQIYLECPSMLFQVFNKYIIRYGLLILGLQAFIVYKCVTRFLTYISLPWPQVTMMNLHEVSMFAISKEWRGHNKNKLLRNNNHILNWISTLVLLAQELYFFPSSSSPLCSRFASRNIKGRIQRPMWFFFTDWHACLYHNCSWCVKSYKRKQK